MAKEIPVPDELKILLPETNKGIIVVGSKGYEIMPLVEGQLEKIMADIGSVFGSIFSMDRTCPKCGKVVKNAIPRKVTECPDDKEWLDDSSKSPVDAIISCGKVPDWVELITGVPKHDSAGSMTLNQIKHFAGLFWKQNFSDDGLPPESRENFTKLLKMIGMGPPEKNQTKPESSAVSPETLSE